MSCGTDNTGVMARCDHMEGCYTRTRAHCYGCGLQHCREHLLRLRWYNLGRRYICWNCAEDHERGSGRYTHRLAVANARHREAGYDKAPEPVVNVLKAVAKREQEEAMEFAARRAERKREEAEWNALPLEEKFLLVLRRDHGISGTISVGARGGRTTIEMPTASAKKLVGVK